MTTKTKKKLQIGDLVKDYYGVGILVSIRECAEEEQEEENEKNTCRYLVYWYDTDTYVWHDVNWPERIA